MKIKEFLKKILFEEIIIDTKELDESELIKKEEEIEKNNKKAFKRNKLLFMLIPLGCIFICYIAIYICFIDRMNGMNFFSFIFIHPIYFYIIMGFYFAYLILVELISTLYYHHLFKKIYDDNMNKSLSNSFVFLEFEITCAFLQYYLVENYKTYIMIMPLLFSIIIIYVHVRFTLIKFSEAYKELEGLV